MKLHAGRGIAFLLLLAATPVVDAGPLHEAARSGNVRDLQALLAQGQRINGVDAQGNTALHVAVAEGQVEAVVALLKRPDISIDQRNNQNETPLHLAGTRGRPFIATRLIEQGADINAQDNARKTPLCNAALAGHPEILQVLLNKGADINGVPGEAYEYNQQRESVPLECALTGGHRAIVDLLADKGAEIGGRVMAAAIATRDRELIGTLLAKGGRIDYQMLVYGERERGIPDADFLKFILDRDRGGRLRATPLLLNAVQGANREHVTTLLDLGININGRDLYGNTALHRAAEYGYAEICQLLLSRGAGVNERTERGNTPLHKAIANGHEAVARVLVEARTNLNARNEAGSTPLHMAAARNLSGIVGFLLSKGADMKIKNERGLTPGQVALEMGHVDLARVLGYTPPAATASLPAQRLPPPAQPSLYSVTGAEEFRTAYSPKPLFASHSPLAWRMAASGPGELQVIVQPQVDNGAVVPVTLSVPSGLRSGDQLVLYVNNEPAISTRLTGTVVMNSFSVRVRMPGSGELRALIKRQNGTLHSAVAAVMVTVSCRIPDEGGGARDIKTKSRVSQLGGTELLVLQTHRMSRSSYVKQIQMVLPNGAIEIELTPWVSMDPLVGASVMQPIERAQIYSYHHGG